MSREDYLKELKKIYNLILKNKNVDNYAKNMYRKLVERIK